MGRGSNNQKSSTAGNKRSESTSLIPMGTEYMQQGFNLLLIGPHGTGKTESVIQAAKAAGLKLKLFNCATLDPYTDLIGVPVPEKTSTGQDHLKMVRPQSLQDAEILFFDEINRAPQATQNAVFEIVQFRTINGEPLPNLKCCWAAMNPPGEDYLVEEVDPALIDRFDAYHSFQPRVSVKYMSQYIDKNIAQALSEWWREHNRSKRGPESYISPRRLMKIGILYQQMGSIRAVTQALPPGGSYDSKKLQMLLEHARDGKPLPQEDSIQSSSQKTFEYTAKGLKKDHDRVINYLQSNPKDLETHNKVAQTLSSGVGAKRLLMDYGQIINSLKPSVIESLFAGFNRTKLYNIYRASEEYGVRQQIRPYRKLNKVLKAHYP